MRDQDCCYRWPSRRRWQQQPAAVVFPRAEGCSPCADTTSCSTRRDSEGRSSWTSRWTRGARDHCRGRWDPGPRDTHCRPTREFHLGKFLYLAMTTGPGITTAVSILSKRVSIPTTKHWAAVKNVIKYLKGAAHFKLKLPATKNPTLSGYADADWARERSDLRYSSSYVFF